ncbi:hypothetical protein JXA59_02570 [Patescibacteria group bacterium]|nr:hypothetical protein [Patescibacteria group bacterium]
MSWFDLILLLMNLLVVAGIVIYFHPPVWIHVLPGGKMPERKTKGAIGYDVSLRALVSPRKMESEPRQMLRLTMFDFLTDPSQLSADVRTELEQQGKFKFIEVEDRGHKEWVFMLKPGGRITGGIGFVTAMIIQLMYWVSPRSGLASRLGITLQNAPGTVDSDYRGEACVVIVNNGNDWVTIYRDMRIAQVLFQWAVLPRFISVADYTDLRQTTRGTGGLGSTKGFQDNHKDEKTS